jgi:hypothetical protein
MSRELDLFFERLVNRRCNPSFLENFFAKAIHKANIFCDKFFKFSMLTNKILKKGDKTINDVFFHIPFHPSHPNSKIKQAWYNIVASPLGKLKLNHLTTEDGYPIPIGRLIMCYHKSPNLGDLFSYRNISNRIGPKVSAYLA